ncbi:hypothetical protein [Oceanirhabdus seepicola]|nr:hypothetical protein [Oceanirhabdus seepicola]
MLFTFAIMCLVVGILAWHKLNKFQKHLKGFIKMLGGDNIG